MAEAETMTEDINVTERFNLAINFLSATFISALLLVYFYLIVEEDYNLYDTKKTILCSLAITTVFFFHMAIASGFYFRIL